METLHARGVSREAAVTLAATERDARAGNLALAVDEPAAGDAAAAGAPAATAVTVDDTAPFRVCVRARPLLPFERAAGEYESLHVRPLPTPQLPVHVVMCHDGRVDRSGRRTTVSAGLHACVLWRHGARWQFHVL